MTVIPADSFITFVKQHSSLAASSHHECITSDVNSVSQHSIINPQGRLHPTLILRASHHH
jgi:hypothetical protein